VSGHEAAVASILVVALKNVVFHERFYETHFFSCNNFEYSNFSFVGSVRIARAL